MGGTADVLVVLGGGEGEGGQTCRVQQQKQHLISAAPPRSRLRFWVKRANVNSHFLSALSQRRRDDPSVKRERAAAL